MSSELRETPSLDWDGLSRPPDDEGWTIERLQAASDSLRRLNEALILIERAGTEATVRPPEVPADVTQLRPD